MLKAGIKVNVFNIRGEYGEEKKSTALMYCRRHDRSDEWRLKIPKKAYKNTVKQRDLLLLAAREKLNVKPEQEVEQEVDPEVEQEVVMNLKHLCRETIRKHQLQLDPHENLFHTLISDYPLYNQTLDDENNDDSDQLSPVHASVIDQFP